MVMFPNKFRILLLCLLALACFLMARLGAKWQLDADKNQ